jgi:hypothetical protein
MGCRPVRQTEGGQLTEKDYLLPDAPPFVQEALALARRLKTKYPDWHEREEAQDALIKLAEWIEFRQ